GGGPAPGAGRRDGGAQASTGEPPAPAAESPRKTRRARKQEVAGQDATESWLSGLASDEPSTWGSARAPRRRWAADALGDEPFVDDAPEPRSDWAARREPPPQRSSSSRVSLFDDVPPFQPDKPRGSFLSDDEEPC